jgi:hypothetical protein
VFDKYIINIIIIFMNRDSFYLKNNETSQLAIITEESLNSGEVFDFTSAEVLYTPGVARRVAQSISDTLATQPLSITRK